LINSNPDPAVVFLLQKRETLEAIYTFDQAAQEFDDVKSPLSGYIGSSRL
jgi:hypothetical protein